MNITTPWGQAQTRKVIAEGIVEYTTASHGGIEISDERRAQMPQALREITTWVGGNWYEEDCDWALVAVAFPDHFEPGVVKAALATVAQRRAR